MFRTRTIPFPFVISPASFYPGRYRLHGIHDEKGDVAPVDCLMVLMWSIIFDISIHPAFSPEPCRVYKAECNAVNIDDSIHCVPGCPRNIAYQLLSVPAMQFIMLDLPTLGLPTWPGGFLPSSSLHQCFSTAKIEEVIGVLCSALTPITSSNPRSRRQTPVRGALRQSCLHHYYRLARSSHIGHFVHPRSLPVGDEDDKIASSSAL